MARRRSEMDADRHWHLDKKIPIALIIAILAQTGGGVWWAATTSSRIDRLEEKAVAAAPQSDRLTRVESKLESIQDSIKEIKNLIQQRPSK